ncbi:MAG: tRNA (adenosine(37)-N6)-threonylcarbamoyltransferase complex ATPase subunit type 1 TsaE [Clostridia bacterium]|nr:tRNA (adenosine(37)-N6)-threonylcarbamoyltransferase complex ATPase subunit type 1 TsaE [Clostridia bacterium]
MKVFRTCSSMETVAVASELGKLLRPGDVICLNGDLGAGKTAFTNGIAEALGIKRYITSPTFTIVNEYDADIPLYHFDVYRISDPEEMFDIGFEEYLSGEGVVVVEWSDLVRDIIPEENIRVNINKDISNGQDVRIISMQFIGDRYKEYENQLAGPNK